ncbi:MAG: glycosyltransferase family 2 protein, partial [Flavobacteriales bacterium]|nr:glycosyltransferase family 2 protein [Flavobacteriales bacterium]
MEVSVIIPCHNEEGNIPILVEKILNEIDHYDKEIILIDDGSTDGTLDAIKNVAANHQAVKYIQFSKNFGHQNAIKAGLDLSKGAAVIMMDADLQHPPKTLKALLEKWKEGYEIVYTQRKDHQALSFTKKITAYFFYKILNWLSGLKLDHSTADFRLLDRKVVDVVKNFHESDLFWRGITFWLGFKRAKISYQAEDRFSGTTKYPFSKMLSFAIKGITSFSVKPLRLSTIMGVIISALSLIYAAYAIALYIFTDRPVEGWTSLLVCILFLGG